MILFQIQQQLVKQSINEWVIAFSKFIDHFSRRVGLIYKIDNNRDVTAHSMSKALEKLNFIQVQLQDIADMILALHSFDGTKPLPKTMLVLMFPWFGLFDPQFNFISSEHIYSYCLSIYSLWKTLGCFLNSCSMWSQQ